MTNLFKRFFTHKSKFLLIIISLLGLAFSYSCSCRDNPYTPPPPTPEGNTLTGGVDNGDGGLRYTTEAKLLNSLMIVNNAGTITKTPIKIEIKNADISNAVLDNQQITLKNESDTLSIEKGFDQISTSEKEFNLTVNLQKKSQAKEKDTISPDKHTFTIKIIKATKIDVDNHISKLFQPDANSVQFQEGNHTFMFKLGTWKKDTFTLELEDTNNDRTDKGTDLTVGLFKKEVEIDNPDQEYVIKAPLDGKGIWIN